MMVAVDEREGLFWPCWFYNTGIVWMENIWSFGLMEQEVEIKEPPAEFAAPAEAGTSPSAPDPDGILVTLKATRLVWVL